MPVRTSYEYWFTCDDYGVVISTGWSNEPDLADVHLPQNLYDSHTDWPEETS